METAAVGKWIIVTKGCSVSITTDYRMDGRGSIPGRGKRFSLLWSVQTGSGAHPASYLMGSWGTFPEGEASKA
jgi:hypothetical protein